MRDPISIFEVLRWVLFAGTARFVADVRDSRLELAFVEGAVEVVFARVREVLDGFLLSDGGGGLERDGMDGFLRSCSVDETGRSCD